MARFKYTVLHNGEVAVPLTEAEFRALPREAENYDLFLWVEGSTAIASKRDAEGQTRRASTRTGVDRLPNDGDLRPASARALLALIRSGEWLTPTEAVVAGNPLAAPPSARNAFLTVTKGRTLLDVELGHERWRSFAQQRKSAVTEEGCLRFVPGDINWLVAWSEQVEEKATALPAPAPAIRSALPTWDAQRVPQRESVYGLEFIIRDAFVHLARDEAVLLLDIRDPFNQGPWRLETLAIVTGEYEGQPEIVVRDSIYPGARVDVPGEQVTRIRAQRQDLPRDVVLQWACVAWSGLQPVRFTGDAPELTLLATVKNGAGQATRRFVVPFRVVRD